ISQMILDMSKQSIEVSEGTLYPILYRLEEKNVIESHWQAPEGRGKPRKYYRVTGEGEKYFKDYQREWFTVADFMKRVMGNV
ncbi:MAG: PadR family transcriptional regulator, partial [Halanaerobiales bacterium]